ncbi:family 78 glycoside hydrolase catalytic domain [Microcella humidisoli]|uniref:alpha-L-rhamnosidase n=1 Tax=Microcella humidisoli TaxID=2963406 RepID=A0ABY5G0E6_9MICO|nr:family 78 glycoside hydrolase catalytic domain [Microcella humidisoli]UTT63617.1 family 78 glycoside hydrolase catalytic domain [Microcella humidisoli]
MTLLIEATIAPLPRPEGANGPWRTVRWALPVNARQLALHVRWLAGSGEILHELRDVSEMPWIVDDTPNAAAIQVRVLVEHDSREEWTSWSLAVATPESKQRLTAKPVGGPAGGSASAGVEYFRRSFVVVDLPDRATLSFTCWGMATVRLNGIEVDEEVLFPGWTDYRYRLRLATVDVSHLLVKGENVLSAEVADGWYRGRLGAAGDVSVFGEVRRILVQLDLPDARIQTDASWRWFAATHRQASLYDGAFLDARAEPAGWHQPGFDDAEWGYAEPARGSLARLVPRRELGVRVVDSGEAVDRGAGVYDCGVNRSGVARVKGRGQRGDRLVVMHSEILKPDGDLEMSSNRGAQCRDEYVLAADGYFEFQPDFTYRGFRFVHVESSATIDSVSWVEYSSATRPGLAFASSNPALEALHDVSLNTVRSNLVSIPTDCPQRDERLGWTGDAQLVAATALRMFPMRHFWESWLRDLIDSSTTSVPPLIPDVVRGRGLPLGSGLEVEIYDRAGWADALVEVPFQLWKATGDRSMITESLFAIRAWLARCLASRGPDGLIRRDFEFGDWLDPTAPTGKPWMAAVSAVFVANAYLARSLSRTASIEDALGHEEESRELANAAATTVKALYPLLPAALDSQGGCAMTLAFGLCPAEERPSVARRLADHVRAAGWRAQTGFLTTPLILEALTEGGYPADAVRLALGTQSPSWQAQVNRGATTWWERWDALSPEGEVGDNALDGTAAGMISFNHLAGAAVADWLHTRVGGIETDLTGRAVARFRPLVSTETTSGRVSQITVYGKLSAAWRITSSGELRARVIVPEGLELGLELPQSKESLLRVNNRPRPVEGANLLLVGRHDIVLSHPKVVHVSSPSM